MSKLELDYSEIEGASRSAKKAETQLQDYADDLKRCRNSLENITGGDSSRTASSYGYLNTKIKKLESKANQFHAVSTKLNDFVNDSTSGAKAIDKKAASKIRKSSKAFCKNHKINVSVLDYVFAWTSTTILNSTSFGEWLKTLMNNADNWFDDWTDDVKHWYECEGGKYVVKSIVKIALIGIAVVTLFAIALPAAILAISTLAAAISAGAVTAGIVWGAITTTATLIGSTITLIDNIVDVSYNVKAYKANEAGDPAWAARYDGINSTSTFFDKHNFGNKYVNRFSYGMADTISFVDTACNIIDITESFKNLAKFGDALSSGDIKWKKVPKSTVGSEKGLNWSVEKYRYKSVKTNWGTVDEFFHTNKYEDYVKANSKLARIVDSKPVKNIEKVFKYCSSSLEKGTGATISNTIVGKTEFIKPTINIATGVDNLVKLSGYHKPLSISYLQENYSSQFKYA